MDPSPAAPSAAAAGGTMETNGTDDMTMLPNDDKRIPRRAVLPVGARMGPCCAGRPSDVTPVIHTVRTATVRRRKRNVIDVKEMGSHLKRNNGPTCIANACRLQICWSNCEYCSLLSIVQYQVVVQYKYSNLLQNYYQVCRFTMKGTFHEGENTVG